MGRFSVAGVFGQEQSSRGDDTLAQKKTANRNVVDSRQVALLSFLPLVSGGVFRG